MADTDFEHAAPRSAVGGFGLVNWMGAACSLALVGGFLTWSVQLTLRDVAEVPVIRALEGPMRVQPENPGGLQASYQGLSVNDIKAGEAAAPAPDRIVLAPAPVPLADPQPEVHTSASAPSQSVPPSADAAEENYTGLDVAALAARIDAADTGIESDVLPETVPGLARSARPQQRPAERPAPAVAAAPAPADIQAVPSGTRLVQLGAFDSPDLARAEWDRLYGQFGDYMDGKQRLVQEARSGGRNFYRLRVVGFDDANDARRFCSAFLARNTACIPVTAR